MSHVNPSTDLTFLDEDIQIGKDSMAHSNASPRTRLHRAVKECESLLKNSYLIEESVYPASGMNEGSQTTTTRDRLEEVTWGPFISIDKHDESVASDHTKLESSRPQEQQRPESKASEKTVTLPSVQDNPFTYHTAARSTPAYNKESDNESQQAEEHVSPESNMSNTSASSPYLPPFQAWQSNPTFRSHPAFVLRAPPPTPPGNVHHQQLSMPTLVEMHPISDDSLIDQYRSERATDPNAFDRRTEQIKEELSVAKAERGGNSPLRRNEYTVELATREDAARYERWAGSKVVEMRSRSISMSSAVQEDSATMSGDSLALLPPLSPLPLLPAPAMEYSSATHPVDSAAPASKPANKVITSGCIRSQTTKTTEVSDSSEKTTSTTWIEITHVNEVTTGVHPGLASGDKGKGKEQEKSWSSDDDNETQTEKEIHALATLGELNDPRLTTLKEKVTALSDELKRLRAEGQLVVVSKK